jgi:hypothetical protein
MQAIEKLLPLFALVGVGVFLFYLLRLAKGERTPVSVEKPSAPIPVAAPVVVAIAAPVVVEEKKELQASSPVEKTVPPPAAPKKASPVRAVLDLLKSKDSMATAFMLREILDPPVSRRK